MGENQGSSIRLTKSVRVNGRYVIPWGGSRPSISDVLRWKAAKIDRGIGGTWKDLFRYKIQELDKTLPVLPLNQNMVCSPSRDVIQVTWIGHATLLVQLQGFNILTDPHFSDFAGPTKTLSVKRYRPPPCEVKDLPEIHAVCISHNHYDHLDYQTVKKLNRRFGDKVQWYVPMGLADWMRNCDCSNVVELEWWEEHFLSKTGDNTEGIKFVCTPSQHWSRRSVGDENKSLWSSWSIIGAEKRFFFAGDTGYNKVFKEIGEMFGPFDLAAIPIGAYKPRWFLHFQHVDPAEAVQIHQDIKSKQSIGMHWGTFPMGHLPNGPRDPPKDLEAALQEKGLDADSFCVFSHGETQVIKE